MRLSELFEGLNPQTSTRATHTTGRLRPHAAYFHYVSYSLLHQSAKEISLGFANWAFRGLSHDVEIQVLSSTIMDSIACAILAH